MQVCNSTIVQGSRRLLLEVDGFANFVKVEEWKRARSGELPFYLGIVRDVMAKHGERIWQAREDAGA